MRYHLRCETSEGEIKIAKDAGSEANWIATIVTQGQEQVKKIGVSRDLVRVQESDGSFRRLAFTPQNSTAKTISFFYNGRPRNINSVGGVAGSVEGQQSEGVVVAPMNGQVIKILGEVGDTVECGEIVLILEAMKMENEVTATISGQLIELSVATGQTVSPGQTMFLIAAVE